MKYLIALVSGIAGLVLAVGAGVGVGLLIARTTWSIAYTMTVTVLASAGAYMCFRATRRLLKPSNSK